MASYRKKPVVIEAVRWRGYYNNLGVTAETPDQPIEITAENMHGVKWEPLPAWLRPVSIGDAGNNPSIVEVGKIYRSEDTLYIGTLEGAMRCEAGDWIIKGVKGEIYPCKPDIFAATYDAVVTKTIRPTIAELEKILQEPDAKVNINSDGSVTTG